MALSSWGVWLCQVLDRDGPEAVAKWVLAQKGVLVTDTTMRDAHQSLLATRVRTVDIEEGAKIAGKVRSWHSMTSTFQRPTIANAPPV